MNITILDIARVAHETNRAYCETLGDDSQVPFDDAPEGIQQSAVMGVMFALGHPQAGLGAQHQAWMKAKQDAGWTYGPEKDAQNKTHPDLVAFNELPETEQIKDALFINTVRTLRQLL